MCDNSFYHFFYLLAQRAPHQLSARSNGLCTQAFTGPKMSVAKWSKVLGILYYISTIYVCRVLPPYHQSGHLYIWSSRVDGRMRKMRMWLSDHSNTQPSTQELCYTVTDLYSTLWVILHTHSVILHTHSIFNTHTQLNSTVIIPHSQLYSTLTKLYYIVIV